MSGGGWDGGVVTQKRQKKRRLTSPPVRKDDLDGPLGPAQGVEHLHSDAAQAHGRVQAEPHADGRADQGVPRDPLGRRDERLPVIRAQVLVEVLLGELREVLVLRRGAEDG